MKKRLMYFIFRKEKGQWWENIEIRNCKSSI